MFNWSENVTLPKLEDALGNDTPPNILRMFTYPWILLLGGWFFAALVGAFGAALYIKYNNAMVPVVFFILCILFFGGTGGIFFTETEGLPDVAIFVYIIGLIGAYAIGTVLYMLFVDKGE